MLIPKIFRGGADNLRIVYMTLQSVKTRIQRLFDFPVVLDAPYKLCDYKPVFGNAFKDYFKDYDFWGYADLDLVFGNIRYFLTDDILNQYDKIYHQGHLSLYRNCAQMNNLYLRILPNGKAFDYKFVFSTMHPCFFDEHCGIERISKFDKVKMYTWSMGISKGVLADISPFSYKFRFSYHGEDLENVYFEYDKGELYLCSSTQKVQAVYVHFAKRKFLFNTNNVDHFKIVPNKYTDYSDEYPSIVSEESRAYENSFIRNFRLMKIKRAFRLGFIEYVKKIIRKKRFMPL